MVDLGMSLYLLGDSREDIYLRVQNSGVGSSLLPPPAFAEAAGAEVCSLPLLRNSGRGRMMMMMMMRRRRRRENCS